ncbi:MAG TPA: hypothetical protein VLC12_05340 [Terriglobales bacterium]|nr:hypothetical protein [Terriglobales bacterium]
MRWPAVTAIAPEELRWVLQQECEEGILAEPHIGGMRRQHSRSWALNARCGARHANTGAAPE